MSNLPDRPHARSIGSCTSQHKIWNSTIHILTQTKWSDWSPGRQSYSVDRRLSVSGSETRTTVTTIFCHYTISTRGIRITLDFFRLGVFVLERCSCIVRSLFSRSIRECWAMNWVDLWILRREEDVKIKFKRSTLSVCVIFTFFCGHESLMFRDHSFVIFSFVRFIYESVERWIDLMYEFYERKSNLSVQLFMCVIFAFFFVDTNRGF